MKAAAYFATRKLYDVLVPAARSLAAHSDVDKIYLFLEDAKTPPFCPDICEVRNLAGQTVFRKTGPNFAGKWTYMSMMRLALPFLLPDLDRVLYLDVDTIVDRDISELWDLDLTGCYAAAVREPEKSTDEKIYVNAGVMMMNLAQLRDGMAAKLIDKLNRHFVPFKEQDVLNEYCQGRILLLPGEYNVSNWTDPPEGPPKIYHFAAIPLEQYEHDPIVEQYRPCST